MGRRKGRKKTRKVKEDLVTREVTTCEPEKELPPLSKDGLKAALKVAPLDKIEELRRM